MNIKKQLQEISKGVDEIINIELLEEKLKKEKPLRIKLGADPTACDIHLGHSVLLNKLATFQKLGHEIIFLIGDFTALIGDPSGKNATRPPLSEQEILENAKTYQEQIFKILDKKKTKIEFNSTWLNKLKADEFIKLSATQTVARMLERDDFKKRFKNNVPIALHEFLYPIMQGYDSVALKADIELGGTDQKFNLLMGRALQKHFKQQEQVIITMPLLVGLDGTKKMSKSQNNYIGITENEIDMFGKIMSIKDEMLINYFELLSQKTASQIEQIKNDLTNGKNPKDLKITLALELIERYISKESAIKAHEDFITKFSKNSIPEDIKDFQFIGEIKIANLLKNTGLCDSTSNAIRMINQGAVKIDAKKILDKDLLIKPKENFVLQVGKRKFLRIKIK